jgi:hypothetical protein
MASETISINLQNTTTGIIDVSIMGNPSDLADNSNATTEYRWNVTGLTLGTENRVSVQYRANSINDFSTFVAPLQTLSVQGVVDALNTLGIGSFFSFTSGGNTFISNYDNDYVFGVLNIYTQGIPQFIYNVNLTGVGGTLSVDVNFVNQLTLNSPVTQSGTITTASGDYYVLGGTTPTSVNNSAISLVDTSSGYVFYSQSVPPTTAWGYALFINNPDGIYVLTYDNT